MEKERGMKTHAIERKGKTNGEHAVKTGVEMDANERLAKARREMQSKNHMLQVRRSNKKVREVDEKHVVREALSKKSITVKSQIKQVREQIQKEEKTKKQTKAESIPKEALLKRKGKSNDKDMKEERVQKEKYIKSLQHTDGPCQNNGDLTAKEQCLKRKIVEKDQKLRAERAVKEKVKKQKPMPELEDEYYYFCGDESNGDNISEASSLNQPNIAEDGPQIEPGNATDAQAIG